MIFEYQQEKLFLGINSFIQAQKRSWKFRNYENVFASLSANLTV